MGLIYLVAAVVLGGDLPVAGLRPVAARLVRGSVDGRRDPALQVLDQLPEPAVPRGRHRRAGRSSRSEARGRPSPAARAPVGPRRDADAVAGAVGRASRRTSSTMRPPAATAAAIRAWTCSCATDTSTCIACRSGFGRVELLHPDGRPMTERVHAVVVGHRRIAEHRPPEARGPPNPASPRWPSCTSCTAARSATAPWARATAELPAPSSMCRGLEPPQVAGQAHGQAVRSAIVSRTPEPSRPGDVGDGLSQSRRLAERPDAERGRRATMQHDPVVDTVARPRNAPPAVFAHVRPPRCSVPGPRGSGSIVSGPPRNVSSRSAGVRGAPSHERAPSGDEPVPAGVALEPVAADRPDRRPERRRHDRRRARSSPCSPGRSMSWPRIAHHDHSGCGTMPRPSAVDLGPDVVRPAVRVRDGARSRRAPSRRRA